EECWKGSDSAKVEDVEVNDGKVKNFNTFEIGYQG
ncbi:MAG: hypothetical protein ABEH43_10065, partial [Flavobacteriales bacterium]